MESRHEIEARGRSLSAEEIEICHCISFPSFVKVYTGSAYQQTVGYLILRVPGIVQLEDYFEDGYFKDFEPYLFGR